METKVPPPDSGSPPFSVKGDSPNNALVDFIPNYGWGGVEGGYYTVREKSSFVFFAPPSEKITHRVGNIRYFLNIIAIRTELYFLWGGWLKLSKRTFFTYR